MQAESGSRRVKAREVLIYLLDHGPMVSDLCQNRMGNATRGDVDVGPKCLQPRCSERFQRCAVNRVALADIFPEVQQLNCLSGENETQPQRFERQ